jgi:hypothetical protein
MDKIDRMIDRFQLLLDIEYDQKRVQRLVRLASRKKPRPAADKK